jgi:hypothetical protein
MQRLAPTQKISDDASFPQRPPAAPGHGALVSQLADTPQSIPLLPRHAPSGLALAQPGAPQPLRAISSAPPGLYATPPAAAPAAPGPPAASVPSGSAKPSRPRPRTAQIIDDPSLALPMVARRPRGLIIVVLLIDVGLAIAGSWMLHEGLGQRPGANSAAGAIHQPPPSR